MNLHRCSGDGSGGEREGSRIHVRDRSPEADDYERSRPRAHPHVPHVGRRARVRRRPERHVGRVAPIGQSARPKRFRSPFRRLLRFACQRCLHSSISCPLRVSQSRRRRRCNPASSSCALRHRFSYLTSTLSHDLLVFSLFRMCSSFSSPRFRRSRSEHRTNHWVWLLCFLCSNDYFEDRFINLSSRFVHRSFDSPLFTRSQMHMQ